MIKPLKYNASRDMTEVSVKLVTGKPHQIRAHLSSVGHPIVGDEKYGDSVKNALYKKDFKIRNQILYCTRVVFPEMPEYPELSGLEVSIPRPAMIETLMK